MGEIAVRVEGLSKQFRIGKQEKYRTFRDTLTDAVAAPFKRVGGLLRGNPYAASNLNETIWALKDVSFEVKKGEVIGIVGRNGAGKSTLLKILSRITEPTEGRAAVYGRVGALLEVGTGFHPELTGRENIYLNGAILGMSREEIKRKFDEIVAFAEVETFIDTPVKHYSSGMGLRLGFAVAAHLEPDILVVDEVLAVGDAQFQKKCLGKITQVASDGRTVLFVSHNLNQIRRLCEKALWIDRGRIRDWGRVHEITTQYETTGLRAQEIKGSGEGVRCDLVTGFRDWYIENEAAEMTNQITHFGEIHLVFSLDVMEQIHKGHHGLVLYDQEGRVAWSAAVNNISLDPGRHRLTYILPCFPLKPGVYNWFMTLFEMGHAHKKLDEWDAQPPLLINTPILTHPAERLQGQLNMPFEFTTRSMPHASTNIR